METKPQNRFRLAPKESSTPTFPTAGAVASHLFLAPVECTTALESLSETVVGFQPTLSIGELKTLKLRTSGYDDPQLEVLDVDEAPEPEAPVPPLQTAPKQIKFTPKTPPVAKVAPACSAVHPVAGPLSRPRMVASTLRTRFALGTNPNKPALHQPPKPGGQAVGIRPVQAMPVAAKPVQSTPVISKPAPTTPVQAKPAAAQASPVMKPASAQPGPTAKPASAPQVTIKQSQQPSRPAAAAAAAAAPAVKPAVKPAEPPQPVEQSKPAIQSPSTAPPEPAKPAAEKPVERPADKPTDKPKINVRPTQPPPQPAVKRPQAPPTPSRPAIAARDHGNAVPVPVEQEAPVMPAPAPAPKPKVQPIRPSATPVHDVPMLGMPQNAEMSPLGGFWSKASAPVKGLIVLALAGVLGGGGYFVFRGGNAPSTVTTGSASDAPATAMPLPGAIISGGGWSPNWGSDAPSNKGKQISIFRPTMSMADYSIVFNGQIEKKAIGWVFRAHDARNYYVYKLKIVKPGVEPVIALEKFAVIDGKEDVHTQVMLNNKASLDTMWNIRTDVQGNKFTTYVQDKLADYMSDDRIKIGGAGFYNDPGEFAQIKNSAFYHLTYKK